MLGAGADAQLPAPVPPADLHRMFRSPSDPFDVSPVGRVVTGQFRIPPVPQVRPLLPPVLAVKAKEHRQVRGFCGAQQPLERSHQVGGRLLQDVERERNAGAQPGMPPARLAEDRPQQFRCVALRTRVPGCPGVEEDILRQLAVRDGVVEVGWRGERGQTEISKHLHRRNLSLSELARGREQQAGIGLVGRAARCETPFSSMFSNSVGLSGFCTLALGRLYTLAASYARVARSAASHASRT